MSSRDRLIAGVVTVIGLLLLSSIWWGPVLWNALFSAKGPEVTNSVRYIKAKKVELKDLKRTIKSIGTLRASNFVNVKAGTRARVAKIYFEDGQEIKKGEPIIEFDTELLKLEYKEKKAHADQLKQVYLRSQQLHKKKLLSATEFEKAKAEYTRAEAIAEEKQVLLNQAVIKAPFDGKLGVRDADVSVGAYLTEGSDIVTIVSTNPMFVDFRVAAHNSDNLKAGQKIEFEIDGPNEKERFNGDILAIDSKVETSGNTLLVRGKVENPSTKIKAGQFVRVSVVTHIDKDAVTVPLSALKREGNNDMVFVMDGQTVAVKGVITGQTDGSNIEIVKGLNKNDIVVFEGKKGLSPGAKVVNLYK